MGRPRPDKILDLPLQTPRVLGTCSGRTDAQTQTPIVPIVCPFIDIIGVFLFGRIASASNVFPPPPP